MALLKLTALDEGDLEVVSAHMQDAIIRLSDIRYFKAKRKFAILANRFVWETVHSGERRPYERRRSGLQFACVREVRSTGIAWNDMDVILSLLSIAFEPGDVPSGTIVLAFAGGAAIRLAVECIEAQLDDLGPAWQAAHAPHHEEDDPGTP